ncbi:hypothetical protein [Siccirubricoccus phaeus]|uniref:hypothetical protein n=1 Tax=Siccirubricoccus phaeus TaxID=2595053 RepID=UPI0011F0EE3D|nr:hypothetical protein [Siccirubricoccus phaeus]
MGIFIPVELAPAVPATYANPFFSSPALGQAFGNLARAFGPDPEGDARRIATAAQARLYGAQADEVAQRMGAASELAQLFANPDPDAAARAAYAAAARGGNPQVMAALPAYVRGFAAAAGADPGRLAQLFVGAGGPWGQTEPGTRYVEGEETRRAYGVTDRQQAGAMAREQVQSGDRRYGVDQGRAGALERTQLEETGRNSRMAPEINPGNVVVVPPGSPLTPRADESGRIAGPPAPAGGRADRPPLDVSPAESARLASVALELLGDTEKAGEPTGTVRSRHRRSCGSLTGPPRCTNRAATRGRRRPRPPGNSKPPGGQ